MIKKTILLSLFVAAAYAQTTISGGITVKGRLDASGASASLPDRTGTGSPVARDNCTKIGETYFQTDAATPGKNTFGCTATGTPGTWVLQGDGGSGSGGSVFVGSVAVTSSFSATPTFSLADIGVQSPVRFEPGALTANVSSVTITSKTSGAKFSIAWLQDGTGGRTVTYGGSVTNPCLSLITDANSTRTDFFEVASDGTTVNGEGCLITGVSGVLTAGATGNSPSTPSSGNLDCRTVTSVNTILCKDSSGNVYALPLTKSARVANQFVVFVDASGIQQTAAIAAADLPATVVLENQANTYSTGLQDFSAADQKLPVHSSDPGTCAAGQIEFNSTGTVAKICSSTNTWTTIGSGGGGSSAHQTSVTFSATPTFTVTASSSIEVFNMAAMTANVTATTLVTTSATAGQEVDFIFLQDGTGGRTVIFATNILNACAPGLGANEQTVEIGTWDGTNVNITSCRSNSAWKGWDFPESASVPAGVAAHDFVYAKSTGHRLYFNPNAAGESAIVGDQTTDTLLNKTLTAPSLGAGSSPLTETWTVGTGGVTANTLVTMDASAPSKIVASVTGAYGVALSTVSAAGTVEVARFGTVSCVTDTGGSTAGHLVILGTGSAINCKDSGQTASSAVSIATRIIGVFRSTATAGATALVELLPGHFGTLVSLIGQKSSQVWEIPAANCVSSTAASAWNTILTPACVGGTNNLGGTLPFVDTSVGQFNFQLPGDWDPTNQPFIKLVFSSATNTSGTVIFNAATACSAEDGTITFDPTFTAADALATRTMTAASRTWSSTVQMTQVTSGNNCSPGGMMLVKITRATDTAASAIQVEKATITVPLLVTIQAN